MQSPVAGQEKKRQKLDGPDHQRQERWKIPGSEWQRSIPAARKWSGLEGFRSQTAATAHWPEARRQQPFRQGPVAADSAGLAERVHRWLRPRPNRPGPTARPRWWRDLAQERVEQTGRSRTGDPATDTVQERQSGAGPAVESAAQLAERKREPQLGQPAPEPAAELATQLAKR